MLAERQNHLTAILNTVVDGVVTIDDRGIIESVNTAALHMFGYTEPELVGHPIALLMPAPHRARYRFLLRRFLDYGADSIVGRTREVPAQRRDGTVFPAELTVGELRLERDRQYVGVIRDVSERKQQEARVRESLGRFQEIAERIEDVFYIVEPSSGHVLYVSPAFDRIFGRALAQGGDSSWVPWIHDEDRERVRRALEHAALGGELDEEYRIVRPDGSLRIVRDRAYPMWEENRITGVVHDVTEERRLEQEARHAQRLEAVGTLASGIAHDFNNLLMGLAGLAKQALRALPADHPAAGLVQRGLESTERGGALTRQLMMFSGQRRAQARPLELDAACRATRELLDRMVGEHIHLTMETGAPGLGVMAEPGEIEQILLNLATNSRDAMPSGGELVVRTQAEGSWVALSVSDTGTGMSAETQARIFEPFYTTKGVGQGTGLGLSTVFAVVRQRDGEVHVDSAPGRGTLMTIKLPVVASNLTTEAPGGATPRGTETVLAVEDDALVRETIQGYLQALGYTALTASHPDVAQELASRAEKIDLLLTDVMMPGRLGGDLASALKQAHPELRVLFMSAHPQSELLRLKRIDPDQSLLSKPFGQHELGVALRAMLAPPSGATAPPRELEPTGESARAHGALIVDDDPDVAETMRDALEQAGVSATVAHSGSEALRLAGTLHPELVLCDVGLGRGEMSGYDVARALRADAGTRDAILVAITGLPPEQCSADATAAGFNQVITKPIDLPMLERLVKQVPGIADHGSR
jgi:PAS domain S-box-containing protein